MVNLNKILSYLHLTKQTLHYSLWELLSYLHVKIHLSILILINLLIWFVAIYIVTSVDQPQIALHYSVDFGIDLYGNTNKIYTVPILGLVFIAINTIIALAINRYTREGIRFITHLLLISAIISNIMLLASLVSIYLINFR